LHTKLGIAGEGWCFHARAVSSVVNGDRNPDNEIPGVFPQVPELQKHVTIASVWDPIRENAEQLADRFAIPHVAQSPAELSQAVDGVLVLGDKSMEFQRHAYQFLESGVPCYVDKPLSPDLQEATEIVELARKTGTPFFSASPARFAPQLQEFGSRLTAEIGTPLSIALAGPGELFFYGVHLVDILLSLRGPDVLSVQNVGEPQSELIKVTFSDGVLASIHVVADAKSRFHVLALGRQDWRHLYIDNYQDYFANLVRSTEQMVLNREAPISLREVLRVIEILAAARDSRLKGGQRIAL